MGLALRIAKKAHINVHRIGNMELIACRDMLSFLDAARDQGICILGVEGFRLEGTSIIPDMGALADFSSIHENPASCERTIIEAKQFILSIAGMDLYFEVVAREPS